MARDEALMIHAGRGLSPPTLRLYQWEPPTISLGYFQPYAHFESLLPPAGKLSVVRRLTGGGAILHDLELTYSISVPAGHPLIVGGTNHLYEVAHDAVIACLAELRITATRNGITDDSGPTRGPFFCFARRHRFDVLMGRDKVAGSAQRRTRESVLQHGSIVVGNRFGPQPTAILTEDADSLIARLRALLPARLASLSGTTIESDSWMPAELETAASLVPKYAGDTWTRRV